MAGRGRVALPADIADLRERVEGWRRSRSRLGAMPEDLWTAAESAARKYGVYATAKAVDVAYGALGKRVNGVPQGPLPEKSAAVGFVEWSGAEILGQTGVPGGAVVEMSDAAGRQVTVRLNSSEGLDVVGIVAAFCGRCP